MTKDEALKLALAALEHEAEVGNDDAYRIERDAIKKVLAQPEQEPALSDEEAEKIFLEMWEMGNEAIRNEQIKKLKGKA